MTPSPSRPRRLRPPERALFLTEPTRALADLATLAPAVGPLASAPRGDGHPVMVIPGFTASDRSTGLYVLNYAPTGGVLSGVVRDPGGQPIDGATVQVLQTLEQNGQAVDKKARYGIWEWGE